MPESWGLLLWWLANAANALIVGFMLRNGSWQRYRAFFWWTVLDLAKSLVLFPTHGGDWYNFCYWPLRVPSVMFLGWVIGEAYEKRELGEWLGRGFAAALLLGMGAGYPGYVDRVIALIAVGLCGWRAYECRQKLSLGVAINCAARVWPTFYFAATYACLIAQYIWLGWLANYRDTDSYERRVDERLKLVTSR